MKYTSETRFLKETGFLCVVSKIAVATIELIFGASKDDKLMESLTLTALVTAIATIISTKALSKSGERIGEAVLEKSGKLVEQLRQQNKLHILTAEGDEPQALDYGEAVLELKGAAEANPDIAQAVIDVEAVVNHQPLEESKGIRELAEEIKSQPSVMNNFA